MSRKMRTETKEESAPADEQHDVDPHGFWDRANLDAAENDDAFAVVIDAAGDVDSDDASFGNLGDVTHVDAEELNELAAWSEGKACRVCRRKLAEQHDPARLRHDECRTALRVGRLLRRYQ